jgi:carbamoyltransferase
VLARAGVPLADVAAIAVAGRATPTVATRLVRPLQRLYAPTLGICFDRPWHPADRLADLVRYRLRLTRLQGDSGGGRLEARVAAQVLHRTLPRGLREVPLRFVDHHLAHAESAWRTAEPGRWLVVTADAHGDGQSLTVRVGDPATRRLALLHRVGVDASLGAFYSYVTRALGFAPGRHEGKVLGLAARGVAARVPRAFPFRWEGESLRYDGAWGLAGSRRLAALGELAREDVAAWVQEGTERILVEGVRRWLEETGCRRVALAGGVFANVRVNGLVAALAGVERLHVFPHMGDGGLAAGAALHLADAPPRRLAGVVDLGPRPTESAWQAAARESGLPYDRPAEPDRALLDLLEAGRPVARCVGSMEYGPRALGHRSVLAPAADAGITQRLNEALRRDDFMPFAPVVCREDADACFEGHAAAADAARFMTVALAARPAFRAACPAAVHVDGSARPQVVSREDDAELYALVAAYRARTGRPALINTSFNLHEEPIVCTPRDAVRAFVEAGLPCLRLGPFVVRNPGARLG